MGFLGVGRLDSGLIDNNNNCLYHYVTLTYSCLYINNNWSLPALGQVGINQ